MLGQTHMIAGALAAAGALHATGAPASYWLPGLTLGAVAALVPDLDSPRSTAARVMPGFRGILRGTLPAALAALSLLLWILARTAPFTGLIPGTLWLLFGMAAVGGGLVSVGFRNAIVHRGPTHSIAALAAFSGAVHLLWPSLPAPLVWSLAAGYGSHILIDLFNPQGVAILWPLAPRKWSVRHSPVLAPLWPLVVRTGGPGELWGWRPALMVTLVAILLVDFGLGVQWIAGLPR